MNGRQLTIKMESTNQSINQSSAKTHIGLICMSPFYSSSLSSSRGPMAISQGDGLPAAVSSIVVQPPDESLPASLLQPFPPYPRSSSPSGWVPPLTLPGATISLGQDTHNAPTWTQVYQYRNKSVFNAEETLCRISFNRFRNLNRPWKKYWIRCSHLNFSLGAVTMDNLVFGRRTIA